MFVALPAAFRSATNYVLETNATMLIPFLAGLTSLPFGTVDSLPDPLFYMELTEAHVCASEEVLAPNEAATFAAIRPFQQGDPTQIRRISSQSPSIQWASAGGQSLKPVLRGLGGNRVLTAYQGSRYDNLQGAADHGLDFPMLGVDHAEIMLGPNTLILGTDALSGVLYLTDVRPRTTPQSELQVYGGQVLGGAQVSHHGEGGGIRPYYLGFSRTNTSEYRDARGDTVHGSEGQTTAIRGLWAWGEADRNQGAHKLAITATSRALGIPEGPLTPSDSGDEHGAHRQSIQGLYSALESQWKVGNVQIRSHQAFQETIRREVEGDEMHLGFSLRTWNSTTTWTQRRPIPKFGESWAKAHTFGVQGFRRELINLSGAEDEIYPNGQQSFIAGFYHSEAESDRWAWSSGIRGEWGSFPVWSGLMRVAFAATEYHHGQLRLSRGSRAPQWEERFADGRHIGAARLERGNPNLGPEQVWNADAQWHYDGPGLEWSGGLFAQSYESFIGLNPVWENGQWIYEYSAGDAQLFGSEWLVHTHKGPWHTQMTYAWVRGQRANGDALPSVAPSKWGTNVRYAQSNHPRPWTLELFGEYFVAKDRLAPSEQLYWGTERLPGYVLLHLDASWTWAPGASVHAGVTNFLNSAYAHPLSLAQQVGVLEPGRQWTVTLSYQW